jgi:hypothetical protein
MGFGNRAMVCESALVMAVALLRSITPRFKSLRKWRQNLDRTSLSPAASASTEGDCFFRYAAGILLQILGPRFKIME